MEAEHDISTLLETPMRTVEPASVAANRGRSIVIQSVAVVKPQALRPGARVVSYRGT
jgi:hypothetical protein